MWSMSKLLTPIARAFPCSLQLHEPAPLGEPVGGLERRVDQVEVDVVQPQPLEALAERRHRRLGGLRRLPPRRVAGPELRGDEQIASRQALGLDRQPDPLARRRDSLP